MKKFTKNYSVSLQPGEQKPLPISGTFVKIRTCTVAFPFVLMAFDDEANQCPISDGDTFPPSDNEKFSHLIFRNTHPTQVATVNFQAGTLYVVNNPSDNRPASTYFVGNLGYLIQADIPAPVNQSLVSWGITNKGFGYKAGDILIPAGGVLGGNPTKIQVTKAGLLGVIGGTKVIDPGNYNVAPASPNNMTGGLGQGAQFNLTYSNQPPLTINAGILTLKNGNTWFVDNVDGNNVRYQIVITVTGGGSLLILDLQGRTMFKLSQTSSPITLVTDAQMYFQAQADVNFIIGETYFAQP